MREARAGIMRCMSADANLTEDIATLLKQLQRNWDRMDLKAMADLWDASDPQPFYLPEEVEEPLRDWDAIHSYWDKTMQMIPRLKMRIWDLQASPVSEDLAWVSYQFHWDAVAEGYDKPVGADNRAVVLFRKLPEGWRICRYVEAPLAPILYMRKLYENSVDADFSS